MERAGKMNVKNMAIIGAVVVAAAAIVLLKQTKKDASAAKDAAQVEAASGGFTRHTAPGW